jgi:hypothetical protein
MLESACQENHMIGSWQTGQAEPGPGPGPGPGAWRYIAVGEASMHDVKLV